MGGSIPVVGAMYPGLDVDARVPSVVKHENGDLISLLVNHQCFEPMPEKNLSLDPMFAE
jgi:hypothetical protein